MVKHFSPHSDTSSRTAISSDVESTSSKKRSSSSDSSSSSSPSYISRSGSPESLSSTSTIDSDAAYTFFRTVCGRELNTMNTTYFLPSDEGEIKRAEQEHRMMKFILGGKSYVGNIAEVLATSRYPDKRILDCGTGSGLWCTEIAEEFPTASVIGVDLAPIQPRRVPQNCSFEIFDLDGQQLPYPENYFDVVHCRSVYTGIRNYSLFVRECVRVLRKGGLIILAECDTIPMMENKKPMPPQASPGWTSFWDEYRKGLIRLGIDITIPTRLRAILHDIPAVKETIIAQEALVPIGFWPKDPLLLTIGQLSWMNHDHLIPSIIPQLVAINGLAEKDASKLVKAAQHELYYPTVRPHCCWHIAHARKATR